MLLNFPEMHPELLSGAEAAALPQGARFLDPGLAGAASAAHLMPEAAPFDRRTAKALLADTLRFGESVTSPRDIAAHGLLQQAAVLAPESGRQVLAEVERSITGSAAAKEEPAAQELEARRQAQTLLLLAWSLEERILDLRRIEAGLRDSWARLDRSVAEGDAPQEEADDDPDAAALSATLSGMTMPEAYRASLPWRRLVESFALLAPGAALCGTDAAIADALAEAGIPEVRVEGAARAFSAPAWRLAGRDRLPADKPWLAADLTLAFYIPSGTREP